MMPLLVVPIQSLAMTDRAVAGEFIRADLREMECEEAVERLMRVAPLGGFTVFHGPGGLHIVGDVTARQVRAALPRRRRRPG
jgi:hypothetical protein